MEQNLKLLAQRMKALSNENRLALYLKILQHEQTVLDSSADCGNCMISEIAAKFNLGAPTISHHIKVLEAAGLIIVKKHGKFISASVNQDSHQMAMRMFHVRPIDSQ